MEDNSEESEHIGNINCYLTWFTLGKNWLIKNKSHPVVCKKKVIEIIDFKGIIRIHFPTYR